MRCGPAALVLAAVACAAFAPPAHADYGPGAEAASANGPLLGEQPSTSPSLSDDGRYVVFSTNAVNLLGSPPAPGETYTAGLVRRDMVSGAVALVAPPRRVGPEGPPISPGPSASASISSDGRYVLFDTSEPLTAGDQNAANDVYVRDMSRPLTDVSAYELVSALDGSDDAPDYADVDPTKGSRAGQLGFSISDDGRRAVFRTEARSTLPGALPGQPPQQPALAPPGQVLVRELDTHRTLLITRNLTDGKPVAPSNGAASPGPLLSGNGNAVAWYDTNVAAQARLLAGEPRVPAILWRDIASGPGAPTRRVAGISDPDDPGCPPGASYPSGGESATDPCFGPFAQSEARPEDGALYPGGISDDGRRVLLQTIAHQRPFDVRTAGNNVYLADMTPGLTRKQGVARILRGASGAPVLAGGGTRLAITAGGSPLFDGPRALGAFPAGIFPTTNVYVMDIEQGIVQRVTVGADGTDYRGQLLEAGKIEDPAPTSLALSDDAGAIAFSAGDGNLFLGDANGAADVQVVRGASGTSLPSSAFSGAEQPAQAPLSGESGKSLAALPGRYPVFGTVSVDARGVARLVVRVPAAGRVTATASAPRGRKRLRVSYMARRTKSNATVHLRLAPTLSARKAARRARKALRVRIDLRYAPKSGRAAKAVRSYALTKSRVR